MRRRHGSIHFMIPPNPLSKEPMSFKAWYEKFKVQRDFTGNEDLWSYKDLMFEGWNARQPEIDELKKENAELKDDLLTIEMLKRL